MTYLVIRRASRKMNHRFNLQVILWVNRGVSCRMTRILTCGTTCRVNWRTLPEETYRSACGRALARAFGRHIRSRVDCILANGTDKERTISTDTPFDLIHSLMTGARCHAESYAQPACPRADSPEDAAVQMAGQSL
jgi:hypothetical protein